MKNKKTKTKYILALAAVMICSAMLIASVLTGTANGGSVLGERVVRADVAYLLMALAVFQYRQS